MTTLDFDNPQPYLDKVGKVTKDIIKLENLKILPISDIKLETKRRESFTIACTFEKSINEKSWEISFVCEICYENCRVDRVYNIRYVFGFAKHEGNLPLSESFFPLGKELITNKIFQILKCREGLEKLSKLLIDQVPVNKKR